MMEEEQVEHKVCLMADHKKKKKTKKPKKKIIRK